MNTLVNEQTLQELEAVVIDIDETFDAPLQLLDPNKFGSAVNLLNQACDLPFYLLAPKITPSSGARQGNSRLYAVSGDFHDGTVKVALHRFPGTPEPTESVYVQKFSRGIHYFARAILDDERLAQSRTTIFASFYPSLTLLENGRIPYVATVGDIDMNLLAQSLGGVDVGRLEPVSFLRFYRTVIQPAYADLVAILRNGAQGTL